MKLLHASATAFFLLAAAYVTVLALRQAGVNWWLIFSLSGYSAASGFVLVSAYLFAVFHGSSRNQTCAIEHPLTSSFQYMTLYSLVPFLGAAAGLLCKIGIENSEQAAGTISMGTIGATFGFWIIIDPLIVMAESFLPSSRAHHLARLAAAKDLRIQQQKQRDKMLELIETQELENRRIWNNTFADDALSLAQLAHSAKKQRRSMPSKAVEIGLEAFKRGGLECMQVVHEMAIEAANARGINGTTARYISTCWDGIGHWRDSFTPDPHN